MSNLPERHHAVVYEICEGVDNIAHEGGDTVPGDYNACDSKIILTDNALGRYRPDHPQLDKITYYEAYHETYCLASVASVRLEDPAFVAYERIHNTGDIPQDIAHIQIPAKERLAYIYHSERNQCIEHAYDTVFDKLQ